jgi:hypothetical protein
MGHFFGLEKSHCLPNSQNWLNLSVIKDLQLIALRSEKQTKKSGELTIEDFFKGFSKLEKWGKKDGFASNARIYLQPCQGNQKYEDMDGAQNSFGLFQVLQLRRNINLQWTLLLIIRKTQSSFAPPTTLTPSLYEN